VLTRSYHATTGNKKSKTGNTQKIYSIGLYVFLRRLVAYITHGEMTNACGILVTEPERKRHLGRSNGK
jgi:hypothetical protein